MPPAAVTGNYLTGLTGDILATGPGPGTATLATVATPGTATKVTFDAKGRVTSGTSLVAADITAALGFAPLNKAGDTVTGDLSLSQLSLPATTAPALSSTGQGRIYFDQSTSEFKVSQNGSAYTKLATGSSVTSVATGAGLTGGPITSSGTISLSSTGVSAGSYTRASVTVDAQGRITGAVDGGNINLATEVSSTLGVANG